MSTIPTCEPTAFIAGDTVKWTKTFTDYPASEWALTYAFVSNEGRRRVTAVADGDAFSITLAASETKKWTPGDWSYQAYAEKDGERYTVAMGRVRVARNLFAVDSEGHKSHVKTTLEALEALIEGKATKDQQEYEIGGRRLVRMSIPELLKWRDKYKAELAMEEKAERISQGLKGGGKVLVRF